MISVTTLLVAILGGLSGGVLGTWLQIKHERAEAMRERQINAADDLSTGLVQAIIGLEQAYSVCLDHSFLYPPDPNQIILRDPNTGEMPAESKSALQRARDLISEAAARRARISLLFGPISAPDRATSLAVIYLQDTLRALEDRPTPDFKKYSDDLAKAREQHRKFNEYALSEVQGRPWYTSWRMARWTRRQARRFARWTRRQASRLRRVR